MYVCFISVFINRLAEQDRIEEAMEREEFGEDEQTNATNIQGILGDRIPSEAVDPTQDPNILVGEVIYVRY